MKPWAMIQPDDIDIVAPDGQVRSRVKGHYSGKQFIIDDMSVDVQTGDEIRRLLPNGKEETFIVDDPKFYKGGPFGPHYQVAISRRGVFSPHTGGNYTVTMSGPNSRFNVGSSDSSTNIAMAGSIFGDIARAVEQGVAYQDERARLLEKVKDLEAARDKPSFLSAYQGFITAAANHMTIIAPFLPALGNLMGGAFPGS